MVDAPAALVSYCAECDALPGDCEHSGARYLDPIVYEKVEHGWRVPADELEQARWHNPPSATSSPAPAQQAKPVQRLVVELEAWVDLDPQLEGRLRAVYELEPVKVTRIVETTTRETQAGKLHSPAGYLAARLRTLE